MKMAHDPVEIAVRRKMRADAELAELRVRRLRGEAVGVDDLPLFAPPPMVRQGDPDTSRAAAARIEPKVRTLHLAVLAAIDAAGEDGLTDRELEQLAQFAHYGPSTIRKRRSELYQLGYLTPRSTRAGLMVWVRHPGASQP